MGYAFSHNSLREHNAMFIYERIVLYVQNLHNYIMSYKLLDIMFISMKHICLKNSWNV